MYIGLSFKGISGVDREGVVGVWPPVQLPQQPQQREPGLRVHPNLPPVPRHRSPATQSVPNGFRVLTLLSQVTNRFIYKDKIDF